MTEEKIFMQSLKRALETEEKKNLNKEESERERKNVDKKIFAVEKDI